MEKDIALVIVSCDRYSDLWPAFFSCFKKYWPDCPFQVFLTTNHLEYKSDSITSIKVGDDLSYSDNLSKALESINNNWILLWLEDCFFSELIDTKRVLNIFDDAINKKKLSYLKLSDDLPIAYSNNNYDEIAELPKGVRYRSAIGMSLYKKSTLNKLLMPGYNAWELDKSDVSNEMEDLFYALTNFSYHTPPLPYVNTVIKGKWYYKATRFLEKEGFNSLIKSRKRQSLLDYLYIRLFLFRTYLMVKLKIYWK